MGGDAGPVHPGHARAQAHVVQHVARLEIVGAVEDEVGLAHEPVGEDGVDVGHETADGHVGVDPPQPPRGGRGLRPGERGVLLVEERLALQVGRLDPVPVHHGEAGHPGPRHRLGEGRAEGTAPRHEDPRATDPRLALAADPGEELLAGVAAHEGTSAIAARAASVMASTGARSPVHASNCPTACATSISTPSIATHPFALAAASSGVSRGS